MNHILYSLESVLLLCLELVKRISETIFFHQQMKQIHAEEVKGSILSKTSEVSFSTGLLMKSRSSETCAQISNLDHF